MKLVNKLKSLGRYNLALKVATVDIKDLIKEFIKEDKFYKNLKSADDFCGKCDGVTNDLHNFLKNKNIKSSIISGIGYLKPLLKNSSKKVLKNDPKYLTHVVVRIGNKVIDLTGKQFGDNPIRILPFSLFKKEWKTIKNGPYWKSSVEGIASKGYTTIGKGDNILYINTPGNRAEATFIIVKNINKYFVISTKKKAKGRSFDTTLINNTYKGYANNALKTIKHLAEVAKVNDIIKYFKENLTP